jgi:hypothetical protein
MSEHANDPERVGAALQRTCWRISETLRLAMGEDGCTALFARSLSRAEPAHPALKDIRRLNGDGIRLDGVVTGIETHGVAAVTAAIEAWLAALIDVLGRLIGEDIAVQLIDHDTSQPRTGDRWSSHEDARGSQDAKR